MGVASVTFGLKGGADWITGRSAAEKMVERFVELFPGKCMICSYHRYGLSHGLTADMEPQPHDCIEEK